MWLQRFKSRTCRKSYWTQLTAEAGGSQFRLGATGTNPSIPATTCYCGQHVQGSAIDHAMTAARGPAVTKGSFLAGAHRELSVALIKCQGFVYRGCANLLARAAGRPVLPGAEVPYVD